MIRFFLICVSFVFLAACGGEDPVSSTDDNPGGSNENPGDSNTSLRHIYEKNTEGYSCFRIPAIVKTKKGTLLAFAEGRKNSCSDTGNIDLVVKRSSDGGETWSELQVVWDDGDNTCGNPAPVVDEETGTIFLLMTWNHGLDDIGDINAGTSRDTRRVFVCHSMDDGETWSGPKEITSATKLNSWAWYATGPCHGIQLVKGVNKGRLVIPCDYIALKSAGGVGGAHVIYSDDKGDTWKLGGYTQKGNESTVAELSTGDLLLNIRISNNNNYRVSSTSSDGGATWTVPKTIPLVDPVCQGSLISGELASGYWAVFFSNPSSVKRENLIVKMSLDDGNTWTRSFSVFTGPSGYSDLVFVSATHLGLLYEAGKGKYTDGIAYKRIAIKDFL